ncbi:MAG: glycosyltransferase family 9 protein [Negativicutes bacterium]|jgi:lipopolysaccharide heptosyltransferase II
MKAVKTAPKKVLLSILVNLGDVVLFTAAAAALKKAWPGTKFAVMVRKAAKDVVENNPLFDEVIVVDYKSGKMSLAETSEFIKDLRIMNYDMAICFDQKLRSLLYMFFARIPIRVVVDGIFGELPTVRKLLANEVVHTRLDPTRDHGVLHFLDVATQITGVQTTANVSVGTITETNKTAAKVLLSELPAGKIRIALCVKGTFPLKDWQPEKFGELIRILAQQFNAACFIVGGPSEREYADRVIACSEVSCWNFCGQTSIIDMAAMLEQSDLLISVCTGTVHVASTTKVPALVIYGCTVPRRWHPLQASYLPIWSMRECSPCAKKPEECPEKFCLREISVEDVLIAAAALLKKRV